MTDNFVVKKPDGSCGTVKLPKYPIVVDQDGNSLQSSVDAATGLITYTVNSGDSSFEVVQSQNDSGFNPTLVRHTNSSGDRFDITPAAGIDLGEQDDEAAVEALISDIDDTFLRDGQYACWTDPDGLSVLTLVVAGGAFKHLRPANPSSFSVVQSQNDSGFNPTLVRHTNGNGDRFDITPASGIDLGAQADEAAVEALISDVDDTFLRDGQYACWTDPNGVSVLTLVVAGGAFKHLRPASSSSLEIVQSQDDSGFNATLLRHQDGNGTAVDFTPAAGIDLGAQASEAAVEALISDVDNTFLRDGQYACWVDSNGCNVTTFAVSGGAFKHERQYLPPVAYTAPRLPTAASSTVASSDVTTQLFRRTENIAAADGTLGVDVDEVVTITASPFERSCNNAKKYAFFWRVNTAVDVDPADVPLTTEQKDVRMSFNVIALNNQGPSAAMPALSSRSSTSGEDAVVGKYIIDVVPDANGEFTIEISTIIGTLTQATTNATILWSEIGESRVDLI